MLRPPRRTQTHSQKTRLPSKPTLDDGGNSIKAKSPTATASDSEDEHEVDDIASKMTSLELVPRKVHFGNRGLAGFSRRTGPADRKPADTE